MGILDKLFSRKKKEKPMPKSAFEEILGEFKEGAVVTHRPPVDEWKTGKMKVKVFDHRTEKEREIEREARAGVSLGPELDMAVDQLMEIGLTEGFFGEGDKFDCDGRNKRAREIGVMLNNKGGFELMQKVWYRVRFKLRAKGGAKCGSLERTWGFIGDWLP